MIQQEVVVILRVDGLTSVQGISMEDLEGKRSLTDCSLVDTQYCPFSDPLEVSCATGGDVQMLQPEGEDDDEGEDTGKFARLGQMLVVSLEQGHERTESLRLLGRVLKGSRNEAGLSREEIARYLGVEREWVVLAENGFVPAESFNRDILGALASCLNVDFASLSLLAELAKEDERIADEKAMYSGRV